MTTRAAMSAAIIRQAISGNARAYEIIRDTIGEKPTENIAATLQDGGDFVLTITGEIDAPD